MYLQAEESQRLSTIPIPTIAGSGVRQALLMVSLHSPEKQQLVTPSSWTWSSQNNMIIQFCFMSHSACGIPLSKWTLTQLSWYPVRIFQSRKQRDLFLDTSNVENTLGRDNLSQLSKPLSSFSPERWPVVSRDYACPRSGGVAVVLDNHDIRKTVVLLLSERIRISGWRGIEGICILWADGGNFYVVLSFI